MAMELLWALLGISGYCGGLSAGVLVQYKYFLSDGTQRVSLQAPAQAQGSEFIWEWTAHDGSYTNARIITLRSDLKHLWNLKGLPITIGKKYDIVLQPKLENAGVYTFIQTKPEKINMAQFEVFAVKVEPVDRLLVEDGSDVVFSCEVSHLPDSATLGWERDGESAANTTLTFNNDAYIIIHSAGQGRAGSYNCTLRWNGELIFSIPKRLRVFTGTYNKHLTLFRGSLNSSEALLNCRSYGVYNKASWQWEPFLRTNVISVASADKHKNASISTEVDKERFSSELYDGSKFPLRISPVKFGDSGEYSCYSDQRLMASVTLVTVQVSAWPPGGLSKNQSVELICEISQVIDSVTLAWLRMEGGRGELVKQEVLSEGHPKKMLSLTVPSGDQLHWACAVFTQSMLRALVPLHPTSEEPKPGWGAETVVRVVITALATLGMLAVLTWYCRRSHPASKDAITGTQYPSAQHLPTLNEDGSRYPDAESTYENGEW